MEKERTKRILTCILTEDDKRRYALELAKTTTDLSALEDRKSEIASEYKAKINRCVAETRECANKISTGKETREVDCYWIPDYEGGLKTLYREDTGEEVDRAKISDEERQKHFDFQTARKCGKAVKLVPKAEKTDTPDEPTE